MSHRTRPVVIDLDGTLLDSDFLVENLFAYIRHNPILLFRVIGWMLQGKTTLKRELAARATPDVAHLPYNAAVIDLARQAVHDGRPVILATATHRLHAERIAAHLGLFDEVIATDDHRNLSGAAKRDALVERFGENGFDYVANAREDICIWQVADDAVLVNPHRGVAERVESLTPDARVLDNRSSYAFVLLRQLRPHQWLKNTLIAVPLIAAHGPFTVGSTMTLLAAFTAFCLCASSVYCLNDLLDLHADRQHPRKRYRPIASGSLPIAHALALAPALLVAALTLALITTPAAFVVTLLVYYALTSAYSFWLKRVVLLDAVALALLYSVRILAGAAAVDVALTGWILAFSLFIFWSLALVKRYTELVEQHSRDANSGQTPGRGYDEGDLTLIPALGAAAGFIAVLVLALYIQDSPTRALYAHPEWLWVACPVLLYWISRTWLLAHRGMMHDDPVVFAIRDPVSLGSGIVFAILFLLAM
ncbi:UbiA family prenyltransferase [Arhodomonas sp. AD133]|uniref:UbiA family prenyltransferase n=1 Tax=Arhodomonas sp. AD133 TaxID=3415009 RepID=UPI003EB71D7A